ncbi:hypothetical protein A3B02_00745 [Candidatus Roizmanbacteria bacterium RIFCSPLOWO2_01_FULL_42_14]|uniref:Uncharacterized protein n=3 Tax=Candidatus Roizmaniibacteriota TaxID=1752723 RepID=A0A1F7JAH7_9BACT|nr:MAG: hypothetical protein A3D08_01560 [Candidatus Roizmanbacteria bacterium RIFCSPHIGHO2_02_FULL_43_11]OGK38837.1 MAG: hypothetical protein A3F32_02035 [Candidatus Roizmanbacteria bacterium RIFCSPHIGHO2_12_FULL_42_10]OGK52610.1 MAG: hypothetical protein A3B02_00745 [Candidatus Roizmanbacteria bacterium RIFCSPLOWO2_01_FULL_42_14]
MGVQSLEWGRLFWAKRFADRPLVQSVGRETETVADIRERLIFPSSEWWAVRPHAAEAVAEASEVIGPEGMQKCFSFGWHQAETIKRLGHATPFAWFDMAGHLSTIPFPAAWMGLRDGSEHVPVIALQQAESVHDYVCILDSFMRHALKAGRQITVYDWWKDARLHQHPVPRSMEVHDILPGTIEANIIAALLYEKHAPCQA